MSLFCLPPVSGDSGLACDKTMIDGFATERRTPDDGPEISPFALPQYADTAAAVTRINVIDTMVRKFFIAKTNFYQN